MTKALAARPDSVPDLVRTPALSIGADDVALSRIYIGQFMSHAVQEQLVKPGCIFSAMNQDDANPQVLWTYGSDEPGVLFHVIGMRKGKSISDGGDLQVFDYDDPAAPEDAWVTYNYTVALPEVDDELPFKLLLTRTGRNTALQINTVLKRNSISGPAWESAFRLTAIERKNAKGKFFVPRAAGVEPTKDGIALAANLARKISGPPSRATTSEEPGI